MATRNFTLSGGGTGSKEIDLVDVAALMLLPIAASMIFEVFSLNITIFGGYDFVEPIWTLGGAPINAALLVVIGSVGWIAVTNTMNDRTEMDGIEAGIALTALGLPILFLFVPAVESLILWHDATF